MGAPTNKPPIVPYENPAGTEGLAFVEFSTENPEELSSVFKRLGFEKVGRHVNLEISLWRQGEIEFLINSDLNTHGGLFAQCHGPCVSALAFRVSDAAHALNRALSFGAVSYRFDRGVPTVSSPPLEGIGGSLLYLTDRKTSASIAQEFLPSDAASRAAVVGAGFKVVDHLTHNVVAGGVDHWANFYKSIFNFREVFYLDARGAKTGFRTRAMMSPCGNICIPVNEPTDPKSQIQEYIDSYKGEGVQHIALRSDDVITSVESILRNGIDCMPIPDSYYDAIDARLPGHGQDVARLRRNGILLDGERELPATEWALLLQLFTKNLCGPIFFECIERRGNEGFGEGNARALFEAIERDQIARGVVTVDRG